MRPLTKEPKAIDYKFLAIDEVEGRKRRRKYQWYISEARPIGPQMENLGAWEWTDDDGGKWGSREAALQEYLKKERAQPRRLDPGQYVVHASNIRHLGDRITMDTPEGRVEIDIYSPPRR